MAYVITIKRACLCSSRLDTLKSAIYASLHCTFYSIKHCIPGMYAIPTSLRGPIRTVYRERSIAPLLETIAFLPCVSSYTDHRSYVPTAK